MKILFLFSLLLILPSFIHLDTQNIPFIRFPFLSFLQFFCFLRSFLFMNFVSNCRKDRKPPPFCFILSSFLNLFVPFCFALTGGLWTFSNIPPLRHVTMLTFDLYSFSLYLYKPKVFLRCFLFYYPLSHQSASRHFFSPYYLYAFLCLYLYDISSFFFYVLLYFLL